MFKFIQAILFIGLLLAVIFLGNRILDEADSDFIGKDQLARQKAVMAENVTDLKRATRKKADELKKMYESVKNAEIKKPVSDVLQKSDAVSLDDNVGQALNKEKLKPGDDSSSWASNDSESSAKIPNLPKKAVDENESEQGATQNREGATSDLLIAKNSEYDYQSGNIGESSSQLPAMDKEDHELTRQILEYSSNDAKASHKMSSMGEKLAANNVKEARNQERTDLDNMAAIMALYSKAAAVLDIK